MLEDFLVSLIRGGGKNGRALAHSTMKGVVSVLSNGLNLAVRRKKIAVNPMENVKIPKGRIKPVIAYTKDELILFLERAKTHRLYAFFFCASYIGFRRGEGLALRWSDFNASNRTLSINKTILFSNQGIPVSLKDLVSIESIVKNMYKKRFYKCQVCSKIFFSGCSLGGHISKKHNIKKNTNQLVNSYF
jgi:hypothetical protein